MNFTEEVHCVYQHKGEFCQKHNSAGGLLSFIVIVTSNCYFERFAGKPLSPGPLVQTKKMLTTTKCGFSIGKVSVGSLFCL